MAQNDVADFLNALIGSSAQTFNLIDTARDRRQQRQIQDARLAEDRRRNESREQLEAAQILEIQQGIKRTRLGQSRELDLESRQGMFNALAAVEGFGIAPEPTVIPDALQRPFIPAPGRAGEVGDLAAQEGAQESPLEAIDEGLGGEPPAPSGKPFQAVQRPSLGAPAIDLDAPPQEGQEVQEDDDGAPQSLFLQNLERMNPSLRKLLVAAGQKVLDAPEGDARSEAAFRFQSLLRSRGLIQDKAQFIGRTNIKTGLQLPPDLKVDTASRGLNVKLAELNAMSDKLFGIPFREAQKVKGAASAVFERLRDASAESFLTKEAVREKQRIVIQRAAKLEELVPKDVTYFIRDQETGEPAVFKSVDPETGIPRRNKDLPAGARSLDVTQRKKLGALNGIESVVNEMLLLGSALPLIEGLGAKTMGAILSLEALAGIEFRDSGLAMLSGQGREGQIVPVEEARSRGLEFNPLSMTAVVTQIKQLNESSLAKFARLGGEVGNLAAAEQARILGTLIEQGISADQYFLKARALKRLVSVGKEQIASTVGLQPIKGKPFGQNRPEPFEDFNAELNLPSRSNADTETSVRQADSIVTNDSLQALPSVRNQVLGWTAGVIQSEDKEAMAASVQSLGRNILDLQKNGEFIYSREQAKELMKRALRLWRLNQQRAR